VKEVSMDMANTMAKIIKMVFSAAVQIVDRFHVMKNVLEDMNALITKNKTEIKKVYLTEQEQSKIDRKQANHQKY
jgi:transposase